MVREAVLSARLKALADMITPGNSVCDVGCDHGFLSIYLIQKKISPRVLAMDVRQGPLSRAKEHVAEYELEEYIETRLSDGLMNMKAGEAQSLVCAGMGGRLMKRILTQDQEKTGSFGELILQPQSELMQFREFLRSCGYRTVSENMIEEEGKFYPMMKAVPAQDPASCGELFWKAGGSCALAAEGRGQEQRMFDRFGRKLLENGNPVLRRYLECRRAGLEEIRRGLMESGSLRAVLRLQEVDCELEDIDGALGRYYHGI